MLQPVFLFLLFLFLPLFSEENPIDLTPNNQEIGIVAGCVNVIGKEFFQVHEAIHIDGPDPLTFPLIYGSSNNIRGKEFGMGYLNGLRHHYEANHTKNAGEGSTFYQDGNRFWWDLHKKDGKWFSNIKVDKTNTAYTNLHAIKSNKNTSPRQMKAEYLRDKYYYKVTLPDGTIQYFTPKIFPRKNFIESLIDIFDDQNGLDRYFLRHEILPSGNHRYYSYDIDTDNYSLARVSTRNSDNSLLLNHITFDESSKKVTLNGSNGQFFECVKKDVIGWKKGGNWTYCRYQTVLDSFKSSHLPKIKFKYKTVTHQNNEFRMEDVIHPSGYRLNVDYRYGKVKTLAAPIGYDGESHVMYRFNYVSEWVENDNKYIYRAEVTDTYGYQKNYHHKDNRVYKVEDPGYRSDNYQWDEYGKLLKYTLRGEKHALLENRFVYDARGNPVRKILLGNLTGNRPNALAKGLKNVEQAQILCSYSNDRFNNLIKEVLQNGTEVHYTYVPDTNLIRSKLTISGGVVQLREFFTYDKNAICIKHIKDDGSGKSESDLQNITYRRITEITPQIDRKIPGFILPAIKEEKYLDPLSQQEHLLSREEYYYIKGGLLSETHVYDADLNLQYILTKAYGTKRRVIMETNALGEKVRYGYDNENQKVREEKIGSGKVKRFKYDCCKRLIQEIESHQADRSTLVTSHSYDRMSRRTKTVDPYGQASYFRYDNYSRLIKEVYNGYFENGPKTKFKDGKYYSFPILCGSTIERKYNCQDQVTEIKDPNGNIKTISYNIRKKPTKIVFPDQTVESYVYSLSGNLVKKVERDGSYQLYTYDYLDRALTEETYSKEGENLRSLQNVYKGDYLVQSIDFNGNVTEYGYDGAGRKVFEELNGNRICFEYDALGRQHKTIYDTYCEIQEFDLLNRVVEVRVESLEGELFSKVQYLYDINGNRTHVRTFTDAVSFAEEVTIYNSQSLPILFIDTAGNETHYTYSQTDHLEKITVDAKGKQTIEVFDNDSNLIKVEEKDIQGNTISLVESTFDRVGNKTKELHYLYKGDLLDGTYLIEWTYNSMNDLLSMCEQQKKYTSYSYQKGRLDTVTKPNGTVLTYSYDSLGRQSALQSSDGTVHYSYTYDKNNNLLSSKDHVHGMDFTRTYDNFNQVIEEHMDERSSVYEYDLIGRPVKWSNSTIGSIRYNFGSYRLDSISRYSPEGDLLYTHQYLEKDLTGRALSAQMIQNAGKISYEYDEALRPQLIATEHFEQRFEPDSFDVYNQLVHYTTRDPLGTFTPNFAYDELCQITYEQGVEEHTYTHDSLSNRRSQNSQENTVNDLNQVTSDGSNDYLYDTSGNLIQINETVLVYDALDRLIQYDEICYRYDSENRRRKKITSDEEITYLYQNSREIGALNADNQLIEFRTLGRGIQGDVGAAIAIEVNGQAYAPVHDHRGNICLLLDPITSLPVETYRYTAFGEEQAPSPALSPWRFSSKRKDHGLIYFGQRYYSPSLGRFISADPSGFSDGPNLYAYVSNNPMVLIDPEGLNAFEWFGYETFMNGYMRGSHVFYSIDDEPLNYENRSGSETVGSEYDPYTTVFFANGMKNTRDEARSHAEYLSEQLGNVQVNLCYNPTFGTIVPDVFESFLGYMGVATTPVKMIREDWDTHFENKEGPAITYCTSQGSINVNNALKDYPEDRRQRIFVYAVANADYIDEKLCAEARHVNSRDPVPWIRFNKRLSGGYNIESLEPHPEAPLFDHSFSSPTYTNGIKYFYENVKNKHPHYGR
ncbi:MAG: RHS repeat-associated core domain-containing protein [Waddliaceae bacterium]